MNKSYLVNPYQFSFFHILYRWIFTGTKMSLR